MVAKTTASKKAKGRKFAKQCASFFNEITSRGDKDAWENESDRFQVRSSGAPGSDIICPAGFEEFDIECKHHEKLNFWSMWKQSKKRCIKDRKLPILYLKQGREVPIVAMPYFVLEYLSVCIDNGGEDSFISCYEPLLEKAKETVKTLKIDEMKKKDEDNANL